jgi:hypothetical protein
MTNYADDIGGAFATSGLPIVCKLRVAEAKSSQESTDVPRDSVLPQCLHHPGGCAVVSGRFSHTASAPWHRKARTSNIRRSSVALHLQHLDLTNCENLTNVGLRSVAALPLLQRLDLFGCKITDVGL